jgi:hypothetical protein
MLTACIVLVGALAGAVAGQRARWRWQSAALRLVIVAVVVAAVIGQVIEGSAWGFPLGDLVWWFDVVILVEELVATVLAIALGTPGCEVGVWPELLGRARGTSAESETFLACVVGLHLLDGWEARRRLSRNYRPASPAGARRTDAPRRR